MKIEIKVELDTESDQDRELLERLVEIIDEFKEYNTIPETE